MPFGVHRPDSISLSAAPGAGTAKIKFLVGVRSAAMSPTYFAQQINTLSALTHGRVIVNIVAGTNPEEHGYYGDFLSHDQRYERTEEYGRRRHALGDPHLWTGAVPYLGAPAISLVGSADDVVEAVFQYRDIGVTEFLFTGFPDLEQMRFFWAEVLPRVRERESASARRPDHPMPEHVR